MGVLSGMVTSLMYTSLLQVLTVTDANRDDLDFTTGFSANMGLATPALVEWLGGSSISRLPGKRVGR